MHGQTLNNEIEPQLFYKPEQIVSEVAERMVSLIKHDETIDYLVFMLSGEPTLDVNLGRLIEMLRPFGIRIAVKSNASLIWQSEVRERLAATDSVLFKLDAVTEKQWMQVNQPHRDIKLEQILEGIKLFAATYDGCILIETRLVRGVNDDAESLTGITEYLARLVPDKAFVSASIHSCDVDQLPLSLEDYLIRAYDEIKKAGSQAPEARRTPLAAAPKG
jgi:wyosine [tRNA(Phe)-imidazoG37] synthetase (radical SAM superfamily)